MWSVFLFTVTIGTAVSPSVFGCWFGCRRFVIRGTIVVCCLGTKSLLFFGFFNPCPFIRLSFSFVVVVVAVIVVVVVIIVL